MCNVHVLPGLSKVHAPPIPAGHPDYRDSTQATWVGKPCKPCYPRYSIQPILAYHPHHPCKHIAHITVVCKKHHFLNSAKSAYQIQLSVMLLLVMLSIGVWNFLIKVVGEILWERRLAAWIISKDSNALIFKGVLIKPTSKSPNKITFFTFFLSDMHFMGFIKKFHKNLRGSCIGDCKYNLQ